MSTSREDMSRRSTLVESGRHILEPAPRSVKGVFRGFLQFACSWNILQIAFGLVIGSAFTSVTTSLISDILLPPLSVLFPLHKNLEEKFAVLRPGANYVKEHGYNTLELAQMDGAVILAYGVFVNRCINFFGLGFAFYGLANLYEYISHDLIIKHPGCCCPYCKKPADKTAARCFNCTSWIDGREELPFADTARLSSSSAAWRKPYSDEESPSGGAPAEV